MLIDSFSKSIEAPRMSPIVSISEEAKRYAVEFRQRTGTDLIYAQRGDMASDTPDYIKQALLRALDAGKTKYPKSGGEVLLQEAIMRKLYANGARNIESLNNIVVTAGGQEALQLAFKLFEGGTGAGFAPCWSCILENQAPYSSICFFEVPLTESFDINYDELEVVLRKVNFFYLNNPQNPTGKVFTEQDIRTIADMCYKYDVFLISDEAYEDIVYDNKKHFSASLIYLPNIICAFTFSKSFSMTGWRLGYVFSRHKRISGVLRLANYSQTAGVPPFIQYAGAEALDNVIEKEKHFGLMREEFLIRRNTLNNLLNIIEGVNVEIPEGAFYFFPSFTKFIPEGLEGKERNEFIYRAFLKEGVVVIPGYCFGKGFEDNIRISFSMTTAHDIGMGVDRICSALDKLR